MDKSPYSCNMKCLQNPQKQQLNINIYVACILTSPVRTLNKRLLFLHELETRCVMFYYVVWYIISCLS